MVKLADLASRIRVSPLIREPCRHSSRCILYLWCCCFGYWTFRIYALINAGLTSSLGLEAITRSGAPGALTSQMRLLRHFVRVHATTVAAQSTRSRSPIK